MQTFNYKSIWNHRCRGKEFILGIQTLPRIAHVNSSNGVRIYELCCRSSSVFRKNDL